MVKAVQYHSFGDTEVLEMKENSQRSIRGKPSSCEGVCGWAKPGRL